MIGKCYKTTFTWEGDTYSTTQWIYVIAELENNDIKYESLALDDQGEIIYTPDTVIDKDTLQRLYQNEISIDEYANKFIEYSNQFLERAGQLKKQAEEM
jgi:hypothetical protein